MASDINSVLKKYLSSFGKNEEALTELTRNLRGWIVENGEVVKARIEDQIDEAAVRMGFAKTSELDHLNARIAELETRLENGAKKSSKLSTKKKAAPVVKTQPVKKTVKSSKKTASSRKRVSK